MRPIKRRQLFEIHDLPWCPPLIRDAITDVLHFATVRHDFYGQAVPLLKPVLEKLGCEEIIDLCSGGSGPVARLGERLEEGGYPVKITLTDLYPNIDALRKTSEESGGRISFIEQPVDATDVPDGLNGFRTIFSSFHHFSSALAESILRDAAEKREGIGVFELNGRDPLAFVCMASAPLVILTAMPFIPHFSWKRFLWTYLIPVIPLISIWDAHVSNLRAYSPDELKELTSRIDVPGYQWEIGQVSGDGFQRITYLLGCPG